MEYQYEPEFKKLVAIYKKLQPYDVLEIGSMFGDTLDFWAKYAKKEAKIVSIDYPLPTSDDRHEKQKDFHTNGAARLEEKYGDHKKVVILPADSHSKAIFDRIKNEFNYGIDFLFIDGDHTYEGVKQDYNLYAPLVNDGGIIAFHDVNGIEGCIRFWNEVKVGKKHREIFESKDGWGIGVLYV